MLAVDADLHSIRLRLPGADAVYLMGPFNNWSTTRTPMQRVDEDRWQIDLPSCCVADPLHVFVWPSGQRCGRLIPIDPAREAPDPALAQAQPRRA